MESRASASAAVAAPHIENSVGEAPPVTAQPSPLQSTAATYTQLSNGSSTLAPAPRLYAPLFSLLNPVEDSVVATPTVSAVEAGESTTTIAADPQPSSARTREGTTLLSTPATGHSTSPSTEPLLAAHRVLTPTPPPMPPQQGGLWLRLSQVWRDMRVACAQEVLPVDQPRRFSAAERAKMTRYESVDTYEPESVLYKDHLETRSREPRWFMWVFVVVVGVSTSAVSLTMAACLHVLNSIRYELLGFGLRSFSFTDAHRYANHTPVGSSSLDVWAMLKGRNVGLYGIERPLAYGAGFLMWLLFALAASALASGVCYLVPESVGSGIPEVKAYLNGVSYPMMHSTRVLVAKLIAVALTVSSGVCTGHYGLLMLIGAMLGAQLLKRRHGVRCYHVHFVDCFRNPRDRRVIVVIGAAAGMASAFCVSVGGLLIILELLSAVFPVRFALYVLAACLLSTLCTQVYLSYWVNFDTRYRPSGGLQRGELLSEAVVLFRTHLPFGQHPAMNLMDFLAAFLIGLCTGVCAVVFVRVSWAALYLRRRLEVALGTKAIRYVLPILFTVVYVSLHYGIAVAFTYTPQPPPLPLLPSRSLCSNNALLPLTPVVCRSVPYAVRSGRNVSTISFYGMNGFLCPVVDVTGDFGNNSSYADAHRQGSSTPRFEKNMHGTAQSATEGQQHALDDEGTWRNPRNAQKEEQSVRVVDSYASLAFAYADSTLQTLLSQRTADLLPWQVLITFTAVYFFSSAVYSGLALCGDMLLPSLVIGAALGRCVGTAVCFVIVSVDEAASSWADPGVFALFGAGSFVAATSGLSFGVGAVLIESTADFRHLLPLMFAILVARRVLARWCRDMLTVYLEARAVPLLNAEPYMERFTLLDARHVMHSSVVALPVMCGLDDIVRVLRGTKHHGFPVVSAHDGTCKGIVTRAQLELLLWHLVFSQGRVSHCTYDVLQRVEDHVFDHRWEGRDPTEFLPSAWLQAATQVSLYPHVDTSAFTVLDTTALLCVYEMFTTLGLRHLMVVDRTNTAVGMITRKDLTGDHLLRIQERKSQVLPPSSHLDLSSPLQSSEDGVATPSTCAAHRAALADLQAPLHPTAAQVAEVARTSSTRRLNPPEQQQQPPVLNNTFLRHQHPAQSSPAAVGHGEPELYARAIRRVSLLHLPRRTKTPPFAFK